MALAGAGAPASGGAGGGGGGGGSGLAGSTAAALAVGGSAAPVRPTLMRGTSLRRPLDAGDARISSSTFAFLFAELVSYVRERLESGGDLSGRLEELGHTIGLRLIELISFRERRGKRDTEGVQLLRFISETCWPILFGKKADSLEVTRAGYNIVDNAPLTNKFISIPKDMGKVNCASFIGGILRGMLDGGGFPATVITHLDATPAFPDATIFAIKFEADGDA